MGLMQLLTVGRSLSEARDRPHRFKLLSRAMPTFGHPDVENRKRQRGIAEREDEVAYYKTDSGEQTMRTGAAPVGKGTGSGMNAYPLGRWTLKANPFKSSSKPAGQPVVQGELSLDKVKVVRNDLSDSDLELVAATRRAEQGGNVFAAATPAAPAREVKPLFWKRLRSRWFRAKAQ
jgi:hypothetical protein